MRSPGSESTVQDRLGYLSMVCANPSDGLSAGLWCEAANEGLMLARSCYEQLEVEAEKREDAQRAGLLLRERVNELEEQFEAARDWYRDHKSEHIYDESTWGDPFAISPQLRAALGGSNPASSLNEREGNPDYPFRDSTWDEPEAPDHRTTERDPASEPPPWTTMHDGVLDHIDRKRADSTPARRPL